VIGTLRRLRADLATYRAADAALQANAEAEEAAGITEETDTYHHLNDAVNDAIDALPQPLRALAAVGLI
jgi:hypothetical protein